VDSGTYYENVNITKQLILRGIGMPVWMQVGVEVRSHFLANGITLNGFTAIGGGYDYDISVPDAGITVTSNYNTLITTLHRTTFMVSLYLLPAITFSAVTMLQTTGWLWHLSVRFPQQHP